MIKSYFTKYYQQNKMLVSKEEPKSTVTDHLCTLFDVYTRSDLDGKWRELVKVYDVSDFVL
jgi:hypothetical protein